VAENALVVAARKETGKGVARKLRGAGRIPGVCYGGSASSVPITLDPRALERLLTRSDAGVNTLIDLKVEGGGEFDGRVVLLKELQRDPVSGRFLHADLYAVDLEQTVSVSVPICLTGIAEGVTMGGILDQSLRELDLECLPRSIPEEIPVDVTALGLGQSLHVRDLMMPEGVTLISDLDISVVSVVAPAAVEEAAPAEEEVALAEGEEAPAEGEAPSEPGGAPEPTDEDDSK
jgi:large subunit ribosomal protein L25